MQKEFKEAANHDTSLAVHNTIREMILNRDLLPGEKINQISMSNLLKTSRTPVINALHRLESEGLVDSHKNTGFFVHRLSIKELYDLFALREAIDIIVVHDIIQFATDEELDEIEKYFSGFSSKTDLIDPEKYRRADVKFHLSIIALCRNRVVHKLNDNFQILARSYMAGLLRPFKTTLTEHLNIIHFLQERNAEKAEQEMRNHVKKTKDLIQETINGLIRMKLDPEKIHVDEISLAVDYKQK